MNRDAAGDLAEGVVASRAGGATSPRVLMAVWTTRMAGGAERFLGHCVDALHARGIPVAILTETDAPADRQRLALPPGVPRWVGGAASLADARAWQPTIVLDHGMRDAALATALAALAPAVTVAHNYIGTCISGEKTHKSITPRACGRTLGWGCLLHYYPNHCGGLNPVTMLRGWHRNRALLEHLRESAGVLALSTHMAEEFRRHDVPRVEVVSPPVWTREASRPPAPTGDAPWRLAFIGRLDVLKGLGILLEALPRVEQALGHPMALTIIGDGPQRARLERRAMELRRRHPMIAITFDGWVAAEQVADAMGRHHLLVMPSVWPEPFGLVGLEAAASGVPTVAFDVGGIPDWLQDGVGGILVRERPRNAAALAHGIARALGEAGELDRLSAGARAAAERYSAAAFGDRLEGALRGFAAASRRRGS